MAAKFSMELGLAEIQRVLNSYGFYSAQQGGGLWVGRHYGKSVERHGDPLADHSHAATVREGLRDFLARGLARGGGSAGPAIFSAARAGQAGEPGGVKGDARDLPLALDPARRPQVRARPRRATRSRDSTQMGFVGKLAARLRSDHRTG